MSLAATANTTKPRVFIKTWGCQMNEYDSSKMADILYAELGYEATDMIESADLILLNTCSIREKAQEKVFSELGRYKLLKDKKPSLMIGVGGCVASQEGDAIRKRAPYVDMVFGPQTLHRLPEMINSVKAANQAVIDISFPEIEKFDRLPAPKAEGPTAFVSIMEGCSKYCTFCVVPYTRGEEVSRPFEDVLAEVAELAEQGVREVNLLGQNVNAYRSHGDIVGAVDLADLVAYVAEVPGIERIRYTTSHPVEFSDRLINAYADVPKLVDHLHLPVQSGSDHILAAMKRGHTALEYKEKIFKLKQIRPNTSLSSDFIIGFPNETEADFQATMDLIQHVGFDHSFSFIYSARPGTPAAQFPDDTPMEVKKQRLSLLQHRIRQQADAISRRMVGTTESVLVDGISKKDASELSGRTENNRVVNFKGDAALIGQVIDLKITDSFTNSLRGELV